MLNLHVPLLSALDLLGYQFKVRLFQEVGEVYLSVHFITKLLVESLVKLVRKSVVGMGLAHYVWVNLQLFLNSSTFESTIISRNHTGRTGLVWNFVR